MIYVAVKSGVNIKGIVCATTDKKNIIPLASKAIQLEPDVYHCYEVYELEEDAISPFDEFESDENFCTGDPVYTPKLIASVYKEGVRYD